MKPAEIIALAIAILFPVGVLALITSPAAMRLAIESLMTPESVNASLIVSLMGMALGFFAIVRELRRRREPDETGPDISSDPY